MFPGSPPTHSRIWHLRNCLGDASEAVPAAMSARVMWAYSEHIESISGGHLGVVQSGRGHGAFLSPPSRWPLLVVGMVLGAAASAFVYRRQAKDPHQTLFLTISAVSALVLGMAAGASTHKILLGYLPWSMCVAMLASSIFFELTISLRFGPPVVAPLGGRGAIEEKGGPFKQPAADGG